MSLLKEARDDPSGAAIIVLGVAIAALILIYATVEPVRDAVKRITVKPVAPPPPEWAAQVSDEDRLTVDGLRVVYWTNPKAQYGKQATKNAAPFKGIVVHYTRDVPVLRLVKYGHSRDFSRGGNSFGYHFYIDKYGRVIQGAPLSVRPNHIKRGTHRNRRGRARYLSSANTIAVAAVGACVEKESVTGTVQCLDEKLTQAQRQAGLAVIAALRERYDLPCKATWGHGDLQSDRASFEGATLTKIVRSCQADLIAGK